MGFRSRGGRCTSPAFLRKRAAAYRSMIEELERVVAWCQRVAEALENGPYGWGEGLRNALMGELDCLRVDMMEMQEIESKLIEMAEHLEKSLLHDKSRKR